MTAISLTLGYTLDKRWEASMRLGYFTGLYGFLAADLSEDNGIFGPVIKAKTIGVLTINIQPTAQTKVKAGRYDYTDDQGDIISFHAAADIFGKALEVGISNTAQSCHCL